MKIPLTVSMATLVIVALLLCAINRQNDIASHGEKKRGYMAFNWNKPPQPATIMNYWRATGERVSAVKNIVLLDYLFMLVYCVYLCWSLLNHRRRTGYAAWLKTWLTAGLAAIVVGTAIDAIQDYKIFRYVTSTEPVGDMRYYTWIKWAALVLGILPLIISLFPRDTFSRNFLHRVFRFISQLLNSLWLFFPGILFLIFPIFCFWMLGQGKDIIVAFIDNRPSSNNIFSFYFRFIFFVAIGFWVYVSWYSSRIIAYIKKRQQLDKEARAGMDIKIAEKNFEEGMDYFEIGKRFLDYFPRIIGNSCFLILELAVLQSPVLYKSITSTEAVLFFVITLIILGQVNRWIARSQWDHQGVLTKKSMIERVAFRKWFWVLLTIFLALALISSFFEIRHISIWVLFGLLLLFHVVFIFYINLRRVDLEKKAPEAKAEVKYEQEESRGWLKRSMDFFCIPRREIGYYRWFLGICAAGIIFYLLAIVQLGFARWLGPFPFIILACAVLLTFGNTVTAFSVRYRINFHFLLFVIALLIGLKETHYVRNISSEGSTYKTRPGLKAYLTAWLADKDLRSDTCYDMYFVMSNGGASRSGYWTAAVLGKIEDSSLVRNKRDRFSDHLFCLSGTSGGGVGVATFFSMLRNKAQQTDPKYTASAKTFLRQDYFTFTFARMLGPDFFNYIFHFDYLFHVDATQDRAAALESSFEKSSMDRVGADSTYPVPFADRLSAFPAMNGDSVLLPILFVNTTRMQDGNPAVVTNLNLTANEDIFNRRIDVVSLLDAGKDISITSGAILGARFPYLSPAGRVHNDYFVDGGYFDNSGAGVVQELIRGIINIGRQDSSLREKIRRLNFKILHIVNSPVGFAMAEMKSVAPIKNDLMSPILTIVGAYDMQTTVNDGRLVNYIGDVNRYEANRAAYTQISLYEKPDEWRRDTAMRKRFWAEPPYAMNWFMSDTTANRINKRLDNNPVLDSLIRDFGKPMHIK